MFVSLRNSKKGISALIAAILVISFIAALLAVMISAFQESFIAGCSQVKFDVKKLDGNDLLCYSNEQIEVTLESEGVSGIGIDIKGQKKSQTINLSAGSISLEQPLVLNNSLLTYGDIKKITFIPLSEKDGSKCRSKAVIKQGSKILEC